MNVPQLRRAFERGRQAERQHIRALIGLKREEFYDHARQCRALPQTAATLALKGDTVNELLDLIGDDT